MMSTCLWTNSGARMCSMLASEPVSKLSTQTTRWPRRSSSSHRCEPRKPAPPVTRHVGMAPASLGRAQAGSLELLLLQLGVGPVEARALAVGQAGVRQALPHHRALAAARAVLAAALLGLDDLDGHRSGLLFLRGGLRGARGDGVLELAHGRAQRAAHIGQALGPDDHQ